MVLSTNDRSAGEGPGALASGANDYLVKLPDKAELIARLRYHSKGYVSTSCSATRPTSALRESQKQLVESNASPPRAEPAAW